MVEDSWLRKAGVRGRKLPCLSNARQLSAFHSARVIVFAGLHVRPPVLRLSGAT